MDGETPPTGQQTTHAQSTATIDPKALEAALTSLGYAKTTVPNPAATPTADPERVHVPKDRLEKLLELERKQAEADAEVRRKEEQAALKRGEYELVVQSKEKEIAASKERETAAETRFRATTRDRELALALAGKPLVPGAAAQLVRLWRDDFDAFADGDTYKVMTRDYKAVDAEVAARLGTAEYAHYLLPTSRGGVANSGAQQTTATPGNPETPPEPANMGEAMVAYYHGAKVTAPKPGMAPVGLRRPR